MVPRSPDDTSKTRHQYIETKGEVIDIVTDIARDHEPIIRPRRHVVEDITVRFVIEMKVGDGEQLHGYTPWPGAN